MERCLIPLLLAIAVAVCVSPGRAAQESVTVKAEFFTRGSYIRGGLAASFHSIAIGGDGYLYAGSLGDTDAEVGRTGKKKIFRITPAGKAEVFAEIECQYITALGMDNNQLYAVVGVGEDRRLVGFDRDGNAATVAAGIGDTYEIIFDGRGGIYLRAETIAKVLPDGSLQTVFERAGFINRDASHYYSVFPGSNGPVYRYAVEEGRLIEPGELLVEYLRFHKFVLVDQEHDRVLIGYFDGEECILIIHGDGRRTNLRIETDYFGKGPFFNDRALGKGGFGENYLYMTTPFGDILRVHLGTK